MTRQRGPSLAPSRGAKRESPFQTGRQAVTAHKPAGPLPGSPLPLEMLLGEGHKFFQLFIELCPVPHFLLAKNVVHYLH